MKIGVIGGGAAGMMAAITAARNGADVTLFEKNKSQKVLDKEVFLIMHISAKSFLLREKADVT